MTRTATGALPAAAAPAWQSGDRVPVQVWNRRPPGIT